LHFERKGTATVDKEFLKSIEEWRRYLATTRAVRALRFLAKPFYAMALFLGSFMGIQ